MPDTVKNYKINKHGVIVASRDLAPGEVVLNLPPIAAGPGRDNIPVCLGCNIRGESDLRACSKCSWPVCSPECETSPFHKEECAILSGKKMKYDLGKLEEKTDQLNFIHTLRLLLNMKTGAEVAEEVKSMDLKVEKVKERNRKRFGETSDTKICQIITKDLGLSVAQEELSRTIAATEQFNIPLDFGSRGVYQDIHKITPSCSPNTYYIGLLSGNVIYRAGRNISEGEVITSCRVALDKCNYFRRKLLEEELVDCSCPRCVDSTEYGTGYGSLYCPACPTGLLVPTSPRDIATQDWVCGGCGEKRTGSACAGVLDSLRAWLEKEEADPKGGHPSVYEKVLLTLPRSPEWGQVPPGSQLMLDVRKALIFTYQYHKEFYFSQQDWLKLKMNHCEEWLAAAEILFPGRSYIKTLIEYERITSNCALVQAMKQDGEENSAVNAMCYKVIELVKKPLEMMIEEEDDSLYKAINQAKMIATEAREEQKVRVYINRFADDDEEEW